MHRGEWSSAKGNKLQATAEVLTRTINHSHLNCMMARAGIEAS
jgi:hypothetical protein